jgi:hypothetical protein
LFILSSDDFVSVAYDESAFWPDDFELKTLLVAASCKDCGEINLLREENPEETESHEREMGSEVYFAGECIGRCSCGLDALSVEVRFATYANQCEFFYYRENDCFFTNIAGYDRMLSNIRDYLFRRDFDEEALVEWVTNPAAGCAVFVEGDDDVAVIDEFLKRRAGEMRTGYAVQFFEFFKPSAEVKRIIARHIEPIPSDFINMFDKIHEIQGTA